MVISGLAISGSAKVPARTKVEMETGLRVAEKVRPADRTEAAVHPSATVGRAGEIAKFTRDRQSFGREADVDRGASRANELTHAAPAGTRRSRLCLHLVL